VPALTAWMRIMQPPARFSMITEAKQSTRANEANSIWLATAVADDLADTLLPEMETAGHQQLEHVKELRGRTPKPPFESFIRW
jgi:hypothetical protein